MTRLFYHHVGREGADRDFPRSLARLLTPGEIEPYLIKDAGQIAGKHLSSQLKNAFPEGFNCWGVPSQAERLFELVQPGDAVFLLGQLQLVPHPRGSINYDGLFEYAGEVRIKSTMRLYETSRYVWTEAKFPLMFFFDSRRIRLPWQAFLSHAGYKSTYFAPALFLTASANSCRKLPGRDPSAYLQFVVKNFP